MTQVEREFRSEAEVEALARTLMFKEAAATSKMTSLFSAPLPDSVEYVPARRGDGFGLRVDGTTLDSLYNPEGYASELLESQPLDDASLVILFGCGGGEGKRGIGLVLVYN